MNDTPTLQPDNTEWVVVAHYRIPIPHEDIVGHYPTLQDALDGLQAASANPIWFGSYSIEHRNKE